MYRLRDLKNGKFQIHVNNGPAYEGTLKQILRECKRFRMNLDEVEIAIMELHRLDDDYAEFGIFGSFMFTMRDEKAA